MAEHEVRVLSKIEALVQGEREARSLNQAGPRRACWSEDSRSESHGILFLIYAQLTSQT